MPIPTAGEIIAHVREQLEDPTSAFFTDEDLVKAYNDALDEISDATEIFERYVTVNLRKHAVYVDLRGILPEEALRVTAVWNCTTGKWLDPTTVSELDMSVGRFWEGRPDTCRWWFMRGLWFLGIYPNAGDDTSKIKIYYSAMMPHVDVNGGPNNGLTSRAPLPPDAHTTIENYMVGSLLAERRETSKSMARWSDYLTGEQELKDIHDQRMTRVRTPKFGLRR
jgi:hypothetical protein